MMHAHSMSTSSASQTAPHPVPEPVAAGHQLVAMTESMLPAILAIEQAAFDHPWSSDNWVDALRSGYTARVLLHGDEVLGYFIAMQVLDEVHLLNITVSPVHQGQGIGRELLDILTHWSRYTAKARWLWLEVRESNARARHLYERYGMAQVGLRKKYYPAHHGERENAILMSMSLWP